jgi:hypothetical protein
MSTTPDAEEWGNIELPGLSDERLLTANWNLVTHALTRKNIPRTAEEKAAISAAYQTALAKHNGVHWGKGIPKSEETKKKLAAASTGKVRSAESLAKASAKLKGRAKPEGFGEKIGKLKQKCIVSPYGIFSSRHALVDAIGRSSWYVDERLRKDPAEYYYISVEEYIMLTGKEPE